MHRWKALAKGLLANLLAIGLFSNAMQAGEVNNGGGIAEARLAYALQKLDAFIKICLITESCHKQAALQIGGYDPSKVLTDIWRALPAERSQADLLRFRHQGDGINFWQDQELKIAITGDRVGDPIYLNLDLFYYRDRTGIATSISEQQAIAILIHELGHHHGIRDHQWLDRLGAAVSNFTIQDASILRDREQARGELPLSMVIYNFALDENYVFSDPVISVANGSHIVDLSSWLISYPRECPQGARAMAHNMLVRDARWKIERLDNGDIGVTLRACHYYHCVPIFSGDASIEMVSESRESKFWLRSRPGSDELLDLDRDSLVSTVLPNDDPWHRCGF